MKKFLYVSLILCLAVLLYAGCKNKSNPVNVPTSIFRVTYSDNGTIGVDAGDELFIAFDRHIQLNSADAAAVFELSDVTDSFGASPLMEQTSGHAIRITLGTGPNLQLAIDDFVTSNIRVSATVPFGAIRDATWLTSMAGGGTWQSIEGRVAYHASRLQSAFYTDEDVSSSVTMGDTITLTFTDNISVNLTGNYWPGWTFIIPVNWDYFGTGAYALQTDLNEVTVTLGDGANLAIFGTHTVGTYVATAPSGIDMAINLGAGVVSFDAGGTAITVPPFALDIQ